MESSLNLKSVRKYSGDQNELSSRVISTQETLLKIIPICKKIGVTRICDITYLDRLYISNYSAVLPGTEDDFWVYSGKGQTKFHAMASALMESMERYCSLPNKTSKTIIHGTYSELAKSYQKVLHPDEVVEPVQSTYDDNKSIIDFVKGFDLLKKEEVLVPAQLVFSKFSANPPSEPVFQYSHTNGLASGNVLEEAICHALCEVIERDAASIADLCASAIPYTILQKITKSVIELNYGVSNDSETYEHNFVDDPNLFEDISVDDVDTNEPLKFLINRFAETDISLLIKDITQRDIQIPTFVASSVEWISSDYGYLALGYGTHPDARIALMRAITELSQTRALNIQGSRDDLKKIRYRENDQIHRRKWQFMKATSHSPKNFSEIRSYLYDDLLDEIKFILNRLKKSGLKRAIIVNLTNPKVGIPVVRAIVPGLETLEVARLYTNSELLMGNRAKTHFRSLLRTN
jgi:ribosomal protein S12 methylthiotransferase accessory factor